MSVENFINGLRNPVAGQESISIAGTGTTWSDVAEMARKTSVFLAACGVRSGDRVVVSSAHDLELAAIYFGCLRSGITAVVLDPSASAAEFTVLTEHADAALIMADSEIIERARAVSATDRVEAIEIRPIAPKKSGFGLFRPRSKVAEVPKVAFPAILDDQIGAAPGELPDKDDTALILYTSGTTSRPKGVEITFGNLAAQMVTLASQYRIREGAKIINHLPLHHSDGLNQGPLLALQSGASLVRPDPVGFNSVGALLDRVFKECPSHLVTVPAVLGMMLKLPGSYDDSFEGNLDCLVLSTAGPLDEAQWQTFEDRFGVRVVNSYGLTETCNEALYCGPDEETRRIGTIGKPVDCEAKIFDHSTGQVIENGAGELLLRGSNIMRGYFRDEIATRSAFQDDWLRTGDMVEQDEEGFFRIVGRLKNIIVRGGTSIYPDDVTAALLSAPGVRTAVTIGIPDALMGERLIACVVANSKDENFIAETTEHLRAELAREKIPDRILAFEELPYGPSGKVALQKLRQMVDAKMGSFTEGGVLGAVASTLGLPVEEVSMDTEMSEGANIDSLRFLELIMSIERIYSVEFSPRETMSLRTFGDLVKLTESKVEAG